MVCEGDRIKGWTDKRSYVLPRYNLDIPEVRSCESDLEMEMRTLDQLYIMKVIPEHTIRSGINSSIKMINLNDGASLMCR